jgi:para-nitrobenzyl esterase
MRGKNIRSGAVVLLLAMVLALPVMAQDSALRGGMVSTTDGPVQGRVEADACSWKGIPYAQPPTGELRWRAPRPPTPRAEVLNASEYGYACPQMESITSGGETRGFSEDCLTLNIWSPQKSGTFPVMLFIHGGAFLQGSGTYDMYNGGRLAAERDVVVVTINYRLGNLGFLALPELSAEDPENQSGNYGLLDQVRALEWVHANIAGFRGDPGNVMVFGQSAGAMSIVYLLVSPRSEGLFQRAAILSAPFDLIRPLADGYPYGRELAANLGCGQAPDVPACLRALPLEKFVTKTANMMFAGGPSLMPRIDGKIVPGPPLDLLRAGKYRHVPIMVGSTRDELRLYTLTIPGLGAWPKSTVNRLMRWVAGSNAPEIMALYDYREFRRPVDLMVRALSDAAISSKAYLIAETIAGRGESPVYYYRFDWDDTRLPHKMGAFHGLDLPLIFGALDLDSNLAKMLANKKVVAAGTPLSEQMMSYYADFARTGDPNGPGLPVWPKYNPADRSRLYFDRPVTVAPLTPEDQKRYQYFAGRGLAEVFGKGIEGIAKMKKK